MLSATKNIESALNKGDILRIEQTIAKAKASLKATDFFSGLDNKNRTDFLALMNVVLPLTHHSELKLRLQAENFITYCSSLISAFYPSLLRFIIQQFDATALDPAEQAAVFTFWTNSLRSVPPAQRFQLIGTCHSIILQSKPEFLIHITFDVWELIRNTLAPENLKSIIVYLTDTSLSKVVAFLAQKNPSYYFDVIVLRSNLQFLKEVITFWPENEHIKIQQVASTIMKKLDGNNSSHISNSIEIATSLINREKNHPNQEETKEWEKIIQKLAEIYDKSTIAQKAAIITFFSDCSNCSLIKKDNLIKFVNFDGPSPLIVAAIKISAKFINDGKIPEKFLEFADHTAIERDPILYMAVLECLTSCFPKLYEKAPLEASRILNHCLNPIPRYYIEQLHILKVLDVLKSMPKGVLKVEPSDVLLYLLRDPHPTVTEEIAKTDIAAPLTRLDWFEHTASYVPLLGRCSPRFASELIEAELVSPGDFPAVAASIARRLYGQSSKLKEDLFRNACAVVRAALRCLGFDCGKSLPSSSAWRHIADALPGLMETVCGPLVDSTFGRILCCCLRIIAKTIEYTNFDPIVYSELFAISRVLSYAFTDPCCEIIRALARRLSDHAYYSAILSFFTQPFPFDKAERVAMSAFECLRTEDLVSVNPYILTAAETSRAALRNLADIDDVLPHGPAFLAVAGLEQWESYVEQCTKEIPFEQWVVQIEDASAIKSKIKDRIKIGDMERLSEVHLAIVKECPDSFEVNVKSEQEKSDTVISIPSVLLDKFEGGVNFTETAAVEEPEMESVDVPFQPYINREPSKADLLGFLWFSNRRVDIGIWASIEPYALSIASDDKFAAAFLSYAVRHSLAVDTVEWSKRLKVNRARHFSVIALAMYLRLVDVSETYEDCINSLMDEAMIDYGYQASEPDCVQQALLQEKGLSLLIVQGIARLRGIKSGVATSEVIANLEAHLEGLSDPYEKQQHIEALCSLFPALPASRTDRFEIPPFIDLFDSVSPVQLESTETQQTSLTITDRLLQFLEETHTFGPVFTLVSNMALTEYQLERFAQTCWNAPANHPLFALNVFASGRAVVGQYQRISSGHSSRVGDLLNTVDFMPPSHSRAVYAAVSRLHAVNTEDWEKLKAHLKPVFFECLTKGAPEAMIDSRYGVCDESMVDSAPLTKRKLTVARHAIAHCESAAATITSKLLSLDKAVIAPLFAAANADTAYAEVFTSILAMAANEFRYTHSAVAVMRVLISKVDVEALMMSIISGGFVQARNFMVVFLFVRMLRAAAARAGEAAQAAMEQLGGLLPSMCESDARRAALVEEDPMKALELAVAVCDEECV